MDLKLFYVQDLLKENRFRLSKVATDVNPADIGTKLFDQKRLEFLKKLVGRCFRLDEIFDPQGQEINSMELMQPCEDGGNFVGFFAGLTTGVISALAAMRLPWCERRRKQIAHEQENSYIEKRYKLLLSWLVFTLPELREIANRRSLTSTGLKLELTLRVVDDELLKGLGKPDQAELDVARRLLVELDPEDTLSRWSLQRHLARARVHARDALLSEPN